MGWSFQQVASAAKAAGVQIEVKGKGKQVWRYKGIALGVKVPEGADDQQVESLVKQLRAVGVKLSSQELAGKGQQGESAGRQPVGYNPLNDGERVVDTGDRVGVVVSGPNAMSKPSAPGFGTLLRESRMALGLGQAALGEKIEPSRTQFAISSWELGKTRPYRQDFDSLMGIFQANPLTVERWQFTEEAIREVCTPGNPPPRGAQVQRPKVTRVMPTVHRLPEIPRVARRKLPTAPRNAETPWLPRGPEKRPRQSESLSIGTANTVLVTITMTAYVKVPKPRTMPMLVWAQNKLTKAGVPEDAEVRTDEVGDLIATWEEQRNV
jgi:hypothetical protein